RRLRLAALRVRRKTPLPVGRAAEVRSARTAPPLWPRSGQGGGWEGVLWERCGIAPGKSTPPRPSPSPAAKGRGNSSLLPILAAAHHARVVVLDDDFDAAVLLAAGGGGVAGHGLVFAQAQRVQPRRGNALGQQELAYRPG